MQARRCKSWEMGWRGVNSVAVRKRVRLPRHISLLHELGTHYTFAARGRTRATSTPRASSRETAGAVSISPTRRVLELGEVH